MTHHEYGHLALLEVNPYYRSASKVIFRFRVSSLWDFAITLSVHQLVPMQPIGYLLSRV